MKQRKTFWLLGLAVGATLPLAQPAQAGILGLSEQEEIRAGQQVAAQAQKEYGRALPTNHPTQRRVRAIGMQFARLSSRKNIPYSYTVLQNDKVLNAFAAPGGPIFVTTKLVSTNRQRC
jgi:predicted Zn-dependent protease